MFKNILSWFEKKNFVDFSWIKKAQFIELDNIDVSEDPVRPELDLDWRKSYDRKIYGLEYNNEIEAIMCLAFTNDVPHTVRELDLMSKVNKYEENADTIIAYTVWSKKKGAGQKIMEEALRFAKTNGFKRIVTLSPLTPMATHYHIRNGAKLLGLNPTTQNFEYTL
jgi:histone acetyltransferase (RNA polymerase elongator complex component)